MIRSPFKLACDCAVLRLSHRGEGRKKARCFGQLLGAFADIGNASTEIDDEFFTPLYASRCS